ncbi:glycosyltransferase [Pararhodospirillum photometricum]|nr:glycosyltransferase [Pararhodospirillum photometricum]
MIQSLDPVSLSVSSGLPGMLQGATLLPVLVFAMLGLHYLWLTALTFRAPRPVPPRATDETALPPVLVQIPAMNEGPLVERALRAACALDYPRDRLTVQFLDDSDDGSPPANAALARRIATETHTALLLRHRVERHGYKAGSLAQGLAGLDSPFVAVFDADFVPPPDFLKRTMPLFTDSSVGFVQTRWGHANRDESLLTRAQAAILDAHFLVEQTARARAGLPLAFNGTCGVWRRAALEEAGGWQGDTLTEDLDLSLRAALAGYRGAYLPDVVVPGELPASVRAWQTQQYRWTKGFAEVLVKLGARVWRSPWPLTWRLAVTVQLVQACFFPLALLSLLLALPALVLDRPLSSPLGEIVGAGGALGVVGVLAFLGRAQALAGRLHPWQTPRDVVLAMVFTSGLMLSNSRAVLEAALRRRSPFIRTPKAADRPFNPPKLPELLSGLALITLFFVEQAWNAPFVALGGVGLLLLGLPDLGLSRPRSS